MEADTQAHVAFFLTGRRPSEHLDAVEGLGLRPALFAGYRDLTQLRYDFPLVLAVDSSDGAFVHSLSGLVDAALPEPLAAAALEKAQVRGMVDDAAGVGVFPVDAYRPGEVYGHSMNPP